MSIILWAVASASLVGVWLNIQRHVACFWIWAVTNAVWMIVDVAHGIPAQACLQGVYLLLAVYGIVKWSRHSTETAKKRGD